MIARVLIVVIRMYQLVVSPLLPPACRFYPSCSEYSLESIRRHGPCKGFLFMIRRLLRCHPWQPGGYDPVPEK